MLTIHAVRPTHILNFSQVIDCASQQVEEFSSHQIAKRLDRQKLLALSKRRRAIRMARGSLSHVPGGVDEFLRRKYEDIERENSRNSQPEVAE